MGNTIYQLLRPLRAVAKRLGRTSWKEAAWNAEYARGQHLHEDRSGRPSAISALVERHARGGDILDLGCGDGHVGLGLDPEAYSSYTGVDISPIAVEEARRKLKARADVRATRNSFVAADVARFVPSGQLDVILFKDSLYYSTKPELPGVLDHYQRFLKPTGVFIVQMDDLRRHHWIRALIRERFNVLEDLEDETGDSMTLVFR
jgi:SAM-dependent methyltransferase